METGRILLRPWQESDAETLFKYASDPEVGPRAGWPPHRSVKESREIIRTVFSAEGIWAVIWKESGEAIGCVGYLPASASNLTIAEDQAEVGYWIARPFWGRGICTEALRMVIDYCFHDKGFTALWGTYFPSNPASGRVMEKCGFVHTGEETLCPKLEVGSDRPIRVMKLERKCETGGPGLTWVYMEKSICLLPKEKWGEALQLVKEVFMEFEAPDYCDEGIADFIHAIDDESYLNMHRFYGAYQDDKLVGVIATRNDHHHIGLLFVDKNYQRRGIGRQLIQHILTLKDDEPITVNASPYGHEFYKKLGFVDTSEEQITNGVRYYPMERR